MKALSVKSLVKGMLFGVSGLLFLVLLYVFLCFSEGVTFHLTFYCY